MRTILVVGGGIVGGVSALLLAQQGRYRVVLLDKSTAWHDQADYQYSNALSLVPPAVNTLQQAGVWDQLPASAITPMMGMHLWDDADGAQWAFHASDIGEACLSYIVDQTHLLQTVQKMVLNHPRIECHLGVTLTRAEYQLPGYVLHDTLGQRYSGELLIGADGVNSWVADQCGFSYHKRAFHQWAMTAAVAHERPHRYQAYQQFSAQGTQGYLPLHDDHHSAVVLSYFDADHLAVDTDEFLSHWQQSTDGVLGQLSLLSAMKRHPLVGRRTEKTALPGVLLLGDAANRYHPMAGQGLNMGLMDVQALVDVSVDQVLPLGHSRVLNQILIRRAWHQHLMHQAMNQFFHWGVLYHQSAKPLRGWARMALNCRSIRQSCIRWGMGLNS